MHEFGEKPKKLIHIFRIWRSRKVHLPWPLINASCGISSGGYPQELEAVLWLLFMDSCPQLHPVVNAVPIILGFLCGGKWEWGAGKGVFLPCWGRTQGPQYHPGEGLINPDQMPRSLISSPSRGLALIEKRISVCSKLDGDWKHWTTIACVWNNCPGAVSNSSLTCKVGVSVMVGRKAQGEGKNNGSGIRKLRSQTRQPHFLPM